MPTGAHDPVMGTNERRLDMLEKRTRDVVTDKARCVPDPPLAEIVGPLSRSDLLTP
jgi:hypothetical protein